MSIKKFLKISLCKNLCYSFMLRIFLEIAKKENESEGDLILGDIGYGLPFRPGTFDGAIRFVFNKII